MLNIEEMKIQNIDHLGIVAGIVDAIGLVEIINNFLGKEEGEKVSAGQESYTQQNGGTLFRDILHYPSLKQGA